MAQIVWTEPALDQLDEIAEYIALDKPLAANELVKRIFKTVDRLKQAPNSGRKLPELSASVYREVLCKPCRVIYRKEGNKLFILHVMRDEVLLKQFLFSDE